MRRFLPVLLTAALAIGGASAQPLASAHQGKAAKTTMNVKRDALSLERIAMPKKHDTRRDIRKPNHAPAPAASLASKKILRANESTLLFDVPLNFTKGTEAEPVMIETDENGNIPESLIGEDNYGFGGSGLYQAGGSLYIGFNEYNFTGTLWTPDVFDVAIYKVTVEARSENPEGDKFNADLYDLLMTYAAYNEVEITNEWNTYTLTVDGSNGAVARGAFINLYASQYGVYLRNLKIELQKPEIATPTALPQTDITDTSFTANWEPVEGATKYLLTVQEFDPVNYEYTGDPILEDFEVEGTSYVVEGFRPTFVYFYWVKATNGSAVSGESNVIEVTDLAPAKNVKAEAAANGIQVSWDAVKGAGLYEIMVYLDHTAKADETYMLADADFSNFPSSGTFDDPEIPEYVSEIYPEMLGWQFYLPQTISGAVGVQENYYYEMYGLYATVESFFLDEVDTVDGKVDISVEMASSTNSSFIGGIYAVDESGYWDTVDYFDPGENLTREFKTFDFTLKGIKPNCVLAFDPYTEEEDYVDHNFYVKKVRASINLKEGGKLAMGVYDVLCEDGTSMLVEMPLNGDDTYYVTIRPYACAASGDILFACSEGEKVKVTGSSAIDTVAADTPAADDAVYNLQGIRVANPTLPGIYIKSGQKFLVK